MKYPNRILPNANYKQITCKISDLSLVRFFKCEIDEDPIDTNTGNLQLKYIAHPTQNIADCSTNLLGIFRLDDIKIAFTTLGLSIYNHECVPNLKVKSPIYKEHFYFDNERSYFTLNISELENLIVPFNIGADEFIAKCIVVHSPMKWNFWHFSIRWKINESEWLHENNNKKWSKRLGSAARASIVHFAQLHEPNIIEINQKCYKTKLMNTVLRFIIDSTMRVCKKYYCLIFFKIKKL